MDNVRQKSIKCKVVWVKRLCGGGHLYCLLEENESNPTLHFDKNYFTEDSEVKLIKTIDPSGKAISRWLGAHSFLEAM